MAVSFFCTQAWMAWDRMTKLRDVGRLERTQLSKKVNSSSSAQPNDDRSDRAAVITMRLGAARAGTKTPEKQAEMKITAGRAPQDPSISWLITAGVKIWPPNTMPSPLPWLVK